MTTRAKASVPVNKPSRLARHWRKLAVAFLILLLFVPLLELRFADSCLQVADAQAHSDVLIVLGGETGYRPTRALELYQAGVAPRILISGAGDCDEVRLYLVQKGVPESAVSTECGSRTTKENAEFSVRWMREQKLHTAVLVTSWFHSRRARQCFRHFGPDLTFLSMPTTADLPSGHWPRSEERLWVWNEYLKMAFYVVRYGIWPV